MMGVVLKVWMDPHILAQSDSPHRLVDVQMWSVEAEVCLLQLHEKNHALILQKNNSQCFEHFVKTNIPSFHTPSHFYV